MGRRFQEKYLGGAHATGPAFAPMRTVELRPEHLQPIMCECGGLEFRSQVKVMGLGKSANIAALEVMVCRACGKARPPDDDRVPLAVREHGHAIGCHDCGGETFEEGYRIFRISRLVIGTARDQVKLVPFFFCAACQAAFVNPGERQTKNVELPAEAKADEPLADHPGDAEEEAGI